MIRAPSGRPAPGRPCRVAGTAFLSTGRARVRRAGSARAATPHTSARSRLGRSGRLRGSVTAPRCSRRFARSSARARRAAPAAAALDVEEEPSTPQATSDAATSPARAGVAVDAAGLRRSHVSTAAVPTRARSSSAAAPGVSRPTPAPMEMSGGSVNRRTASREHGTRSADADVRPGSPCAAQEPDPPAGPEAARCRRTPVAGADQPARVSGSAIAVAGFALPRARTVPRVVGTSRTAPAPAPAPSEPGDRDSAAATASRRRPGATSRDARRLRSRQHREEGSSGAGAGAGAEAASAGAGSAGVDASAGAGEVEAAATGSDVSGGASPSGPVEAGD